DGVRSGGGVLCWTVPHPEQPLRSANPAQVACAAKPTEQVRNAAESTAPLVIGRALRAGMKPMPGECNVGASQPSARPYSAKGPVVRAAVCIASALWSLTSPALAQSPAPTQELQGRPIQPVQGGKPVGFRQPSPVAFDKGIPGNSALAKTD